jgi:hypothetical protein
MISVTATAANAKIAGIMESLYLVSVHLLLCVYAYDMRFFYLYLRRQGTIVFLPSLNK